MNVRVVSKVLGLLCVVIGISMLWALYWAYVDDTPDKDAIILSIAISVIVGIALFLIGTTEKELKITSREAFAIVTFGWIIAAALGALPFFFMGYTYTDSFFEAMSGFTTTGASIMTNIEANPRGILFWRDLTHWLGGMGIIVLSLAVLPFLGVGGMELYKAEVPGPVAEKLTPRVQQTAMLLWGVYVFISALEVLFLWLGGMNIFESLTHTFGTMATGGFSPLNSSIGQYNNPYFDWVITAFMFIAGANFALHYMVLKGNLKAWWKDPEFKFYTGVIVFSVFTATLFLFLGHYYDSFIDSLRYASFQVVSIITTTGYTTADYEKWPVYIQTLLLVLMFVGGCAGSTGGGIKNIRILILLKRAYIELYKLVHPRAVISMKVGENNVDDKVVNAITAFFFIYIAVFSICTLIMSAMGLDPLSAIASVAATLCNIGPGLGSVGPADNYAHIPSAGKWLLSFCMLLGRLELYTVLVLLVPATWRR